MIKTFECESESWLKGKNGRNTFKKTYPYFLKGIVCRYQHYSLVWVKVKSRGGMDDLRGIKLWKWIMIKGKNGRNTFKKTYP